MRIRRRLTPAAAAALSDLQSQAGLPSDQPFDPSKRPSDQSMENKNDETQAKTKLERGFGDDDGRWSLEGKNQINDDIRKIVNICCGGEDGTSKVLLPSPSSSSSSSSSQEGNTWCEQEYKTVPLKKRRGSFERNPDEEMIIRMGAKMKSKTNKKLGDENVVKAMKKGCRRGNVIMEGSRCSRINGRGWRCCQPTLVGYSLCEHHLGKGRLRNVGKQQHKRAVKVGMVKSRSMSSLLSQIS